MTEPSEHVIAISDHLAAQNVKEFDGPQRTLITIPCVTGAPQRTHDYKTTKSKTIAGAKRLLDREITKARHTRSVEVPAVLWRNRILPAHDEETGDEELRMRFLVIDEAEARYVAAVEFAHLAMSAEFDRREMDKKALTFGGDSNDRT